MLQAMGIARHRRDERTREASLEERPGHASFDRDHAQRVSELDQNSVDLFDVPAAVVCAFCGDADCTGCTSELSRSGIVSVIAWERPAVPLLARLWSTARATTRDTEGFFELLPDGPLLPALRFAATCELLAGATVFATLFAAGAILAPDWMKHVALDPHARSSALRVVGLGLPGFAGLLVGAHAIHGLSIDIGASRSGGRSARSRALRFGLYACGWDLVMGPIGAVVVAVNEGVRASLGLASSFSGLPTRATNAFLRGCYRMEGERARRALAISHAGAAIATLGFVLVFCAAIAAVVLR